MGCGSSNTPSGESLVVLAAAVAIQLAQGRSDTELDFLAAFLQALGDDVALIAAQRSHSATLEAQQEECKILCNAHCETGK